MKSVSEQITWLEDFIKRWEASVESNDKINLLIDEYEIWTKERGLPHLSADELLCKLIGDSKI